MCLMKKSMIVIARSDLLYVLDEEVHDCVVQVLSCLQRFETAQSGHLYVLDAEEYDCDRSE